MFYEVPKEQSMLSVFGIAVIIITTFIFLGICYNLFSKSIENIEEYHLKIQKECTLIRKISGDYIYGSSPSYTPNKKCYLCPNGVEECF